MCWNQWTMSHILQWEKHIINAGRVTLFWCLRRKWELHLTTDNFFPKEANSTILAWGETRRSLTALNPTGRWMSSFSCEGIKLICKTHKYKKLNRCLYNKYRQLINAHHILGLGNSSITKHTRGYWIKFQKAEITFTLVSTFIVPIPDSLRAIIKIWLDVSTSKIRAPSTCMSFFKKFKACT